MKPSFFISLLLIMSTIFIFEAQGARLLPEEFTPATDYQKVPLNTRISRNHHDLINSSGKEVMGATIPGRKVNYSVKSLPEQYPDILDIAGMDYTSARRKTPIHN